MESGNFSIDETVPLQENHWPHNGHSPILSLPTPEASNLPDVSMSR